MFDKIINYGDSFTHTESCECAEEDLWFRHVLKEYPSDKFINRAWPGNNPDLMVLEAVHDCLSQQGKLLQIFSIPPITRLPMYTDEWYNEAKLKSVNDKGQPTQLEDCQKYFSTFSVYDVNQKSLVPMFHPVLRWTQLYSKILQLDTLSAKHGNKIIFVHMHHKACEYSKNPLTSPFEDLVKQMPNYFDESISCNNICFEAGINPIDVDKFGRDGHHGSVGQEYFGRCMTDKITNCTYLL